MNESPRSGSEFPTMSTWGEQLAAAERPRQRWQARSILRRFGVPLATFVIGAGGATGIAIASGEDSPGDDGLVDPERTSIPVPVGDWVTDIAPVGFECEAYQRWGREVYIPWWNERIASGRPFTAETPGEVPVPPLDICEGEPEGG